MQMTVYEKGAEVVRLYNTLLGRQGFRKGELYKAVVWADDVGESWGRVFPRVKETRRISLTGTPALCGA